MKSLQSPVSATREPNRVAESDRSVDELAKHMAVNVCRGFNSHDDRERQACIEAFYEVDRYQFPSLPDEEVRQAAKAYVDALWAKDEVEEPHLREDGTLDREALADADRRPIEIPLERRADIVGMPHEYASATAEGWIKHKTGGDYWTPHMSSQRHEVRAALGDPDYPHKRGTSPTGVGSLPARYLVAIELHDLKSEERVAEAVDVMQTYYSEILRAHSSE